MTAETSLFGFLNCCKPAGLTSRDVVNVVQRRIKKGCKVGHAGTLDPMAEGVLILALGPASRLVPFVQQLSKRYRAVFRLGQSSDTGDLEGELQYHRDLPIPSLERLRAATRRLTGAIEQVPPAHSAIWIDGRRAYERARAGERVEMPSRTVRIDEIKILRYEFPELEVDIGCGSGTYIRTLGMDIAKASGTEAVMSFLQRTAIGPFGIDDTVDLRSLREEPLESLLVPPIVGVAHLERLAINEAQSKRLGHGLCLEDTAPPAQAGSTSNEPAIVERAAVLPGERLRAIVRRKRDRWCPYRVFPIESGKDSDHH